MLFAEEFVTVDIKACEELATVVIRDETVVLITVAVVLIVVVIFSAGGGFLEITHAAVFHQLSQVAQGRGLKKE